jgi:riboflavin synthase
MFTGIITDIGTISRADMQGDLRLDITCNYDTGTIRLGDSIACNGACLTVVEILPKGFGVQLSAETVGRTAPGQWDAGKRVNLERALRMGDTLDGHLVTGHVDAVAHIRSITPVGDSHTLEIAAPGELARFIAPKGSVTLDGVSLTINSVDGDGFCVNIIPHTWVHTTLGERRAGGHLNIEIDTIARYVARLLDNTKGH